MSININFENRSKEYPKDKEIIRHLTNEELLEAVVQHGVKVHGYEDTPEFRSSITKEFKDVD